jgi:NitT/TauT family transport system substrate-binding protein
LEEIMKNQRRRLLKAGAAGAGIAVGSGLGFPAIGQARTKLRVGYVNTLAVNGQIWTGIHQGHWAAENLELETTQFNTGLELFNAMIGGSLDMLSTGAVISNFPARGKGKKISTTTGTTAHVFLDTALRANKLDPTKDVEIVNQRMPEAVTAFISGAVPAVALWVPFNLSVRSKVPTAKMLVDASAYFPQAAIVGGWAARTDYYEKNRDICARVVRAWSKSNDSLMSNPDAILPTIQKNNYAQVPLEELREQFKASRYYSSAEWRKLYTDGTATRWLQQVTDFFVRAGGIQNAVPAATYFDTKLFLDSVKA